MQLVHTDENKSHSENCQADQERSSHWFPSFSIHHRDIVSTSHLALVSIHNQVSAHFHDEDTHMYDIAYLHVQAHQNEEETKNIYTCNELLGNKKSIVWLQYNCYPSKCTKKETQLQASPHNYQQERSISTMTHNFVTMRQAWAYCTHVNGNKMPEVSTSILAPNSI